jgi:CheY-like chemotaxis protein
MILQDGRARPGHYVRLTVDDTGSGMSDETRRRALDPFFTTKEPGKGTGLGLSTVYGIVKQSHGYLWIDSQLGCGTSVTALLPVATSESVEPTAVAPVRSASAGRTESVLLVEDEEALRLLAQRTLERAGHLVVAAANALDAEAAFDARQRPIDVLVTDVVMPGGTGLELYHRLAAKQPGMKAVFISGYTDPAVVDGVRLMPNTTFLQKPFTAEALLRSVAEWERE